MRGAILFPLCNEDDFLAACFQNICSPYGFPSKYLGCGSKAITIISGWTDHEGLVTASGRARTENLGKGSRSPYTLALFFMGTGLEPAASG